MEKPPIFNLARKDGENSKVGFARYSLPFPKLIWFCLKPPKKAFATESFQAINV